jgi:hypothetical protein
MLFSVALALSATASIAQTPPPKTTPPEPPLRRWFELQTLTVYTRYRFTESNADVVNTNDLQYKEAIKARANLDAKRRYTVNAGAFSGSSFISTWDNTGLGRGAADFHNHYLKQLYAAAIPTTGLELQYGGLYISKGESTDYTTYDEDGYIVGERISVRRPKIIYFDEVSLTRAKLGPTTVPNLNKRWNGLTHPNYSQLLVTKRFSQMIAGSADYSTQSGADTIHAAVSLRFKPNAPFSALRYEQYARVTAHPANGFAVTAERPVTKWVRLQAGYVTIDERFGNLNADRIQRGRRFFANAAVPIVGPFSASVFISEALHAPYPITNRTRFDVVFQYDVLNTLRKTGIF